MGGFRRAWGILPLTGAGSPLPQLEQHLRSGGFVCLLADRDLSRSAVDVVLCGRPARMPVGPALLARATGAALLPTTCAYAGTDLEITLHEEIEVGPGEVGVRRATQQVADAFSVAIRAHPEDWHMLQRVFGEDTR